jgi:hypothetical protein
MFDLQQPNRVVEEGPTPPQNGVATQQASPPAESVAVPVGEEVEARGRRSEAGRKGAYRVHQFIREGKLYEQEHGLKRGRQRLRQLIELGKLYEAEHGLRSPRTKVHRERLSRTDREDVLATFLRCLVRLAKPSFRAKLVELSKRLREAPQDDAA